MIIKKAGIICFLTVLISSSLFSQVRVTTVGIQVKPIIPYQLLNTGERTIPISEGSVTIDPQPGYAFGMIIRTGLTETLSLEAGINYVARNYHFDFQPNNSSNVSSKMLFDGYEMPVVALVFIRLGERMYMNTSAGASFDFYPTGGIVDNQQGYEFAILEKRWVQTSLLANLGFEYRTEKSGYFYLGASFHRPFTNTANFFLSQRISGSNSFIRLLEEELSGNYLTIDLRYFFPEKPRTKN